MSLDPNNHSNAVTAAANALQAAGIAQTNSQHQQQHHQHHQHQHQQDLHHQQQQQQQQAQSNNQFINNQFYQQSQHQRLLNAAAAAAAQSIPQSQYTQAAQQQLAQHLPQSPVSVGQSFTPSVPQSEFTTRQELISYIHSYARENGFGIVISHSNEKAIYFTCELGGTYRNKRNINDKERKRKLTTRKINCPFTMVANCKKNENEEIVKWVLRITNPEHNHDKLNLNESFPMLRRRNPEINRQIRELYLKGHKPLVIEKLLKANFPEILINREDIYNETRKMKREERLKNGGQSSISRQSQSTDLKDADNFEQNIPNLLQQNLLANQYVSQSQPSQNQIHQLTQNQYNLQALNQNSNVVNQALANVQQQSTQNSSDQSGQNQQDDKDTNLSNIDINLVKQQGL